MTTTAGERACLDFVYLSSSGTHIRDMAPQPKQTNDSFAWITNDRDYNVPHLAGSFA